MNYALAFILGFSGAIIGLTFLMWLIVGIVADFKSGKLYFQLPIGKRNDLIFSKWTFHTDYGRKAKDATMRIEVLTDKGIVILPTHSIVDWLAELQDMQPTGASQQKQAKKKAGQNNNQKQGQTGQKSQKGFIGTGKTIKQDDKVLLIKPKTDLYPYQKVQLSDGTIAQIQGIQLNRQSVQKANAGEHVGIELDVNAIAGAIHKA